MWNRNKVAKSYIIVYNIIDKKKIGGVAYAEDNDEFIRQVY